MVVARASGTDLASSLKQNTFLTLGVRPAGGSPPIDGHPRVGWARGGVPPYRRSPNAPRTDDMGNRGGDGGGSARWVTVIRGTPPIKPAQE